MRMENEGNYIARSTPTLSGLLAELLRCEHRKMMELTKRRTHREQGVASLENDLTWLLAR
jgi:hypothetical protein